MVLVSAEREVQTIPNKEGLLPNVWDPLNDPLADSIGEKKHAEDVETNILSS